MRRDNASARTATLVIVDMQRAFQDSGQWQVPRYDEIVPVITRLRDELGLPNIYTRFIRDEAERGSWSAYYRRWDEMQLPATSAAWNITLEMPQQSTVIDAPTFSKWGRELAELIPSGHELVLAGVATDCCVLATALGAVDAGRHVTVVADACAAVDDDAQHQALALLRLLSPMCNVVTSDEVIPALAQ